jgi:hypothetical protein
MFAFLLTFGDVGRSEIYKFVDKDGVMHFTAVPINPSYSKPILPGGANAPRKSKPKKHAQKRKPTTWYHAEYTMSLEKVECPADPKDRNGPKQVVPLSRNTQNLYWGERFNIAWTFAGSSFAFMLENSTENSMKILWDESAFIDPGLMTHRVMHTGIKFIDRNNPQPPTIIARRGRIQDEVLPVDNVEWLKNVHEWYTKPIFEAIQMEGSFDTFQKTVNSNVGKSVQVLLALEVDGVANDYIFTFKIDNVNVKKESR